MFAYGTFAVSLLLPEGGRVFGNVVATSLWTSWMLARMRLVQEGFKPLPNRYLVTQHSINQHGKEGSKEGRSWGTSSSQESDEGHIHPRQGWIAAIRKKDLRFVQSPEKNNKNSFTLDCEFFPTQQVTTFIFSGADFHSGDLVLLFRILALKFSGLGTLFFPEQRCQTKSQIPTWRLPQRTQGSNNLSQGALCCWWRPRRHKRSISTWELPCYLSWVTDEIFQSFVPLVLRRTFVFRGSLVHGYQVMWLARIETKSVIPRLLARG